MRLLGVLFAALVLAGCSTSPAAPAATPVDVQPVQVAEPVGLDIGGIGVHVGRISKLTLDSQGGLEIPADAATVGWYPLGPAPGEVGPAILTGHVNYDGTAGVFARLHELKPGSRVTVPRADGTTAEFTVFAVDEYPKDAFPTAAVYGDTTEPVLRLITCGGDLDASAHSYRDNIVVSARLAA